jgi:DNA processing protein
MLMLTSDDVLALRLLGGVTNDEIIRLAHACDVLQDALAMLGAMPYDLERLCDEQRERCSKHDVTIVTIVDAAYPSRLRQIANPPSVLFVAGTLPDAAMHSVGVVGTRQCTHQYGLPVTRMLVADWARSGTVIVSGLANGIDTIAHEAAIQNNTPTIAVIASGIDRITPKTASDLARRISSGHGAVVSEHPCGVAALPPAFPARNRIIAALSDAVVVVESKARGGALITAEFALQQGKPLYAVPGPITSARSEGCNALCASGKAEMLLSSSSVKVVPQAGLLPIARLPIELQSIDDGAPHYLDEFCAMFACDVASARSKLLEFELLGFVTQLAGERFVVRR